MSEFEFGGIKLTKEQRIEAITLAWDGMEKSQFLLDAATNPHDRGIATALYEAYWCLWQVLTEDHKKRPR